MRQYECQCLQCGYINQVIFKNETYPDYGDVFQRVCKMCNTTTEHTRTLTKKTAVELRKRKAEETLRKSIENKCAEYDLKCHFVYQSVVIKTHISTWSFDYHRSKITLYHESTWKINFETGRPAKVHVQFRNQKMTPLQVIEYIYTHDQWKGRNTI